MFRRLIKWLKNRKLSLSSKLTLGLSAIAVTLLLSSVISVLEYRRMSNYVSDLIATNINNINISRKLANAADNYNLRILEAIGSETLPGELDAENQMLISCYDSLITSFTTADAVAKADSVVYSYTAYMLTTLELENVLMSDFMDTRAWYFETLQPRYNRLRADIENLNDVIYQELEHNSETFQAGFYRSIMPGVVSVGAGLLLVILFYIFMMIYYVKPLKKMLKGVNEYRSFGKRYNCDFDGNDELFALNDGMKEVIDENVELKRRVGRLREERDKLIESESVSEI